MYLKLCVRLGLIMGGATGALIGLLYGALCCTPPHPPTFGQLALDGALVAGITGLFCLAYAWLVIRLPLLQLFGLIFLLAIAIGVVLGPLAYHVPYAWLALLVCAVLGAILGWFVCSIACGRTAIIGRRGR